MADPSDQRLQNESLPDHRLRDAVLWAMTEFSAAAGHEINNPVATIVGYAQQLARGETDLHRRETLLTIAAQAYRIRDMIADCMLFARPPEPKPAAVTVAAVVNHVLTSLRDRIPVGLNVETHVPADLQIWADPDAFAVVVSELVLNAINACRLVGGPGSSGETETETGSEQSIETSANADARGLSIAISASADPTVSHAAGNWIRISIADTGTGLSAADCDQIFNPFYSGRVAGRGLGFGLSKCWRIATQHLAEISAIQTTPRGMTFTIVWPADAATAAATAIAETSSAAADGKATRDTNGNTPPDAGSDTAAIARFARHVR